MKIASTKEVQETDQYTIKMGTPSLTLMERAGTKIANELVKELNQFQPQQLIIFAGKGNNGGDAMVVSRKLYQLGWVKQEIVLCFPEKMLSKDAKINWKKIKESSIRHYILSASQIKSYAKKINKKAWIVDGLLGTGFRGKLQGELEGITLAMRRGEKIFSIDIPSGLNGDTGESSKHTICSDVTYTVGMFKKGFLQPDGINSVGRVVPIYIGLKNNPKKPVSDQLLFLDRKELPSIRKRKRSEHKGSMGHLAILGGSPGMTGAVCLCASSAMRVGAGKVSVAISKSLSNILEIKLTEPISVPLSESWIEKMDSIYKLNRSSSAWIIGPGAGQTSEFKNLLNNVFQKIKNPLILDADALNCCAEDVRLLNSIPKNSILTPHPGEMARLIGQSASYVQNDRVKIAADFAKQNHVYVVVKGAMTVVATPRGKTFINSTGNPAMASAGMGDVLAGMIGGLLVQGYSKLQACLLGVYLHGLAGDICYNNGQNGPVVLAEDVVNKIGEVFCQLMKEM